MGLGVSSRGSSGGGVPGRRNNPPSRVNVLGLCRQSEERAMAPQLQMFVHHDSEREGVERERGGERERCQILPLTLMLFSFFPFPFFSCFVLLLFFCHDTYAHLLSVCGV